MKRVLVLAGGEPQISLIRELHSRGFYVILADYYAEPIAKKYADKFYQESTLDVEKIKEIAASEEVCFLITVCTDQALLTVARVSEELGLPCYVSYDLALQVTNKTRMKETLVKHRIPTARHKIFSKGTLNEFDDSLQYPLVVKPANCNSSKGIRKVFNKQELATSMHEASQCSRTGEVVVEEFIFGCELSVESYVEDGVARVLTISQNEKIRANDKFVIYSGRYPVEFVENSLALRSEVERIVQQVACAFHLTNSPLLIQMLTDGKKVYVVELSARTGGGYKHLLVRRSAGFDPIKAVVDLTLGIKPSLVGVVSRKTNLALEYVYGNGTFDRLEGFDDLQTAGVIETYSLYKWRGARLSGANSSGDRIAGFVLEGDTFEELSRKYKETVAKIKVLDDSGKDILLRDLLIPPVRTDHIYL